MDYLIVILIALGASTLTFFSGFGLGTILTPAFILFLRNEIELAIAATAIVHLLNNVFKLMLVGSHAQIQIIARFGIPSMIGAFIGASLLTLLSDHTSDMHLTIIPGFETELLNFVVGLMIVFFSLFELIPAFSRLEFDRKWLVSGGLLSGFFGGLSGHQGALRSAFLLKLKLNRDQFIATGISIAVLVDLTRIGKYMTEFDYQSIIDILPLLLLAIISAFTGAIIGKKLLVKVTMKSLQYIVGAMMMAIGALMCMGLI